MYKHVALLIGIIVAVFAAVVLPQVALIAQQNENREILLEERREAAYYDCTKNLLSWIETKDGVRTYFSDRTGKYVADKKVIKNNERMLQRCEDLYGKDK